MAIKNRIQLFFNEQRTNFLNVKGNKETYIKIDQTYK